MAEQFPGLSDELRNWIGEQHVFFVATAAPDGRVNLSPKGRASLAVLDANTLLWMNLTGSGNETAAHLREINRITMMWCAFEGLPRILRVYGNADVIHPRDESWQECTRVISAPLGARQYFKVHIDLVQTSCGYAVPFMDFVNDRDVLEKWADKRGHEGIATYWQEKNQRTLHAQNTAILDHDA